MKFLNKREKARFIPSLNLRIFACINFPFRSKTRTRSDKSSLDWKSRTRKISLKDFVKEMNIFDNSRWKKLILTTSGVRTSCPSNSKIWIKNYLWEDRLTGRKSWCWTISRSQIRKVWTPDRKRSGMRRPHTPQSTRHCKWNLYNLLLLTLTWVHLRMEIESLKHLRRSWKGREVRFKMLALLIRISCRKWFKKKSWKRRLELKWLETLRMKMKEGFFKW